MTKGNLSGDLQALLNGYSLENDSNTPDYTLARYLLDCLDAYNKAVMDRAHWYGRMDVPGRGSVPFDKETGEEPPNIIPGPIDVNWS